MNKMKILQNYINGKFVDSKATDFFEVRNPATDEVLAKVPKSTEEEVNAAVKAAQDAFPAWRNTPGVKRIQPNITGDPASAAYTGYNSDLIQVPIFSLFQPL